MSEMEKMPGGAPVGRGTGLNPPNRFERLHIEPDPDCDPSESVDPRTEFYPDATESLLTRNDSPDISFRYGLNSYRGCEHGCAYCYARPYHEYLGWGSGIDFETKIMVKLRAPELLRRELSSPKWVPQPIGMSGVTDCYQPAERKFRLSRQCLEVLAEFRNPVGIVTKNHLVTRDIDVLAELSKFNCVAVFLTITTLDTELSGKLEPRASRPQHRLRAIRELSAAGIPVGVMVAPVIPGLTEHELPSILEAAAEAGAKNAGYVILRLPHAVKQIFVDWLERNEPLKKERVLSRVRDLRGGKLNVSEWATRMKGEGIFAEQVHDMFKVATRRAGLNETRTELSTEHFRSGRYVQQMLF
ncbi:MAG TPA: PA0069 family radical SAM protein [Opitutaceae bacterium]|nr:PA0069 family radical SAM protein [Opitutaceae bacterium]